MTMTTSSLTLAGRPRPWVTPLGYAVAGACWLVGTEAFAEWLIPRAAALVARYGVRLEQPHADTKGRRVA